MAGRKRKTPENPPSAPESESSHVPEAVLAAPSDRPEAESVLQDAPLQEPDTAAVELTAPALPDPEHPAPDAAAAGQDRPEEPAPETRSEADRQDDAAPTAEPEPVPESEPDRASPPPASSAPPPPRQGSGFLLILGGVVAAALGYGVAQFVPDGWPIDAAQRQISALERKLDEQAALIAGLQAPDTTIADRMASLEAQLAAVPAGDPDAVAALRAEADDLRQQVAALQAALDQGALAPVQEELADLRASVAALPDTTGVADQLEAMKAAAEAERAAAEARAEALRAEAETTARAAMVRGAILRVQAALEGGGPFDAALGDLASAGIELPARLTANAEGIATLAELQAEFPAAARAALAATQHVETDAAVTDRLGAFLRRQTGMRSLTPREGDDPDAILSRAEAALRRGDLAATLAELDTAPPEAAPALSEWRALAETRAEAAAALADLAASIDVK